MPFCWSDSYILIRTFICYITLNMGNDITNFTDEKITQPIVCDQLFLRQQNLCYSLLMTIYHEWIMHCISLSHCLLHTSCIWTFGVTWNKYLLKISTDINQNGRKFLFALRLLASQRLLRSPIASRRDYNLLRQLSGKHKWWSNESDNLLQQRLHVSHILGN